MVLADLCCQLYHPQDTVDEPSATPDDIENFQSLLDSPNNSLFASSPQDDDNSSSTSGELLINILSTSLEAEAPLDDTFQVYCMDSGSQRTVNGIGQAKLYPELLSTDLQSMLHSKRLLFRFGSRKFRSMGHTIVSALFNAISFLILKANSMSKGHYCSGLMCPRRPNLSRISLAMNFFLIAINGTHLLFAS